MRKIRKSEINQIIKENSSLSDEDLIKKYFDILYRDVLGSQAERMEEAGYEESDVRERREYEDYMDGYTDILEWMLQRRGVDPWKDYMKTCDCYRVESEQRLFCGQNGVPTYENINTPHCWGDKRERCLQLWRR